MSSGPVALGSSCMKFSCQMTARCSNWKWPDIKGLGRFQGKMMHSASWDESYDLTAKTVAVIGIGSSAVQILPRIAKGE